MPSFTVIPNNSSASKIVPDETTPYYNWSNGNFTPLYAWERELKIGPLTTKKIEEVQERNAEKIRNRRNACRNVGNSGGNSTDSDKAKVKVHEHFISRSFAEYCDNTSLHGWKFVSKEEYYCIERIVWVLLCSLAWVGIVIFIKPSIERYMKSPMITSIESTSIPVYQAPFPAVTICNVNKADSYLAKYFAKTYPWKTYSNYTVQEVIDKMALFSQVVDLDDDETAKETKDAINDQKNEVDNLMKEVAQPIERMALKCWFLSAIENCTNIFQMLRTDEGYCWSFNARSMSDLSRSDTFLPTNSLTTSDPNTKTADTPLPAKIPIRHANAAGNNMGLIVMLNPDVGRYYATTHEFFGFKVLVHHPLDFPSVTTKAFLVTPGQEVYSAVIPTEIRSSPDIQQLDKKYRDCRFSDEETLSLYNSYSNQNCRIECQVKSMNKTCGCVPYIYSALSEYYICNFDGLQCLRNNARSFLSIKAPADVLGVNSSHGGMENCYCPSSCNSMSYTIESSTAQFSLTNEILHLKDVPEDVLLEDTILLRIYYKNLFYVQYKRDLTYTWDSFVAEFGGIVGLFEGFSIISAVELIYFFTFRPFFQWMKEKN